MACQQPKPPSPRRTPISENKDRKDNDTTPTRSSLSALPSDLHVQLVSYLDFRDLEMLRATNSYFRNLPTPGEIDRAKKAYISTLLELEVEEVRASKAHREAMPPNTDTYAYYYDHTNEYLTCYTCFRRRDITRFANTQATRRRTKGHADAYKRFCCDCAVRLGKWESGTIITLPDHRNEIFCRRCMTMQQLPRNTALWGFGLCEDCRVRTGVVDVGPSICDGESSLVHTETAHLFHELYGEYRNARKPVPEEAWEALELDLQNLRADRELLEPPSHVFLRSRRGERGDIN